MAFRYTFDDGPEKTLKTVFTMYALAAMAAFAKEKVEKLPSVQFGTHAYDGHVLKIWSPDLVPEYGPYHYGIGLNEAQSIVIVTLIADAPDKR